jgi:hypothetical protein
LDGTSREDGKEGQKKGDNCGEKGTSSPNAGRSKDVSDEDPVGARLARDEVLTFNIDVARHSAIASRLAPTICSWLTTNLMFELDPCGSGARDGGVSSNMHGD